jgi:hypothetical protein
MNQDDEPGEVIHVTPSYPPGCQHEWHYEEVKNAAGHVIEETPTHCVKCGMSFTRYIFTECP